MLKERSPFGFPVIFQFAYRVPQKILPEGGNLPANALIPETRALRRRMAYVAGLDGPRRVI